MAARKTGRQEHKVVVTLPDMGLSKTQIASLKRRFKNDIVTSMGGPEALPANIIIIIVVVIIAPFAAK